MGIEKTIYKYQLYIIDSQIITIPKGGEIISTGVQDDIPCIWVHVNKDEIEVENIQIEIYGTGNIIHCDMGIKREFIGSFQLSNGFVGHIFKILN